MLQVNFLKENREQVLAGLKKRNFKQMELVDEAISLDEERKKLQFELDNLNAEKNKISKEIGLLLKEGKKEEAEAVKIKTSEYAGRIKELEILKPETERKLQNVLYLIPNIPYELVKEGTTADDNEIIYQFCEVQGLGVGYLPHW